MTSRIVSGVGGSAPCVLVMSADGTEVDITGHCETRTQKVSGRVREEKVHAPRWPASVGLRTRVRYYRNKDQVDLLAVGPEPEARGEPNLSLVPAATPEPSTDSPADVS